MRTKVVWSNSPELGLGPGCSGSRPSALSSLSYPHTPLRQHPISGSMAPPGLTWHLGPAVHVLWDLEWVLSKPPFF